MSEAAAQEDLPGDLISWVLIGSRLLVSGAGLLAFLVERITDPSGFGLALARFMALAAGLALIPG